MPVYVSYPEHVEKNMANPKAATISELRDFCETHFWLMEISEPHPLNKMGTNERI